MQHVGIDASAIAPFLFALLSGQVDDQALRGMAPDVRRKQTFEALRALFLAISRQRPLVLAVEDLHWIDQPSEAFLRCWGKVSARPRSCCS